MRAPCYKGEGVPFTAKKAELAPDRNRGKCAGGQRPGRGRPRCLTGCVRLARARSPPQPPGPAEMSSDHLLHLPDGTADHKMLSVHTCHGPQNAYTLFPVVNGGFFTAKQAILHRAAPQKGALGPAGLARRAMAGRTLRARVKLSSGQDQLRSPPARAGSETRETQPPAPPAWHSLLALSSPPGEASKHHTPELKASRPFLARGFFTH